MLIVCRTKAPRRELTVIGSQYQRVRRVEMPVKMGCSRQSASPWLVLPGMRSAVETESAVKKCSLAVIGEVSALASRNQVYDLQGDYDVVWKLAILLGVAAAMLHWWISEAPVQRELPQELEA